MHVMTSPSSGFNKYRPFSTLESSPPQWWVRRFGMTWDDEDWVYQLLSLSLCWLYCNTVQLKMEPKDWFRRLEQKEANVKQLSLTDVPYYRLSEWIMYSWNPMNEMLLKEVWLHHRFTLKSTCIILGLAKEIMLLPSLLCNDIRLYKHKYNI